MLGAPFQHRQWLIIKPSMAWRVVSSSITGLTAGTPYYVRAYATNSVGTGYGSDVSFTTLSSSVTVTDIDGNVYQTVTIGNQVWMAENLEVTRYRNGNSIPNVTESATWAGLTTGAYCNYNNDTNYVATPGRLYNWYAESDSRNIAPVGWHVPSDAEWQTMIDYLGGDSIAGGRMKETGTAYWCAPNTASNESGFSALPSGFRDTSGAYHVLGCYAGYWSSTDNIITAFGRSLNPNGLDSLGVYRFSGSKPAGFSIRCVKDAEEHQSLILMVMFIRPSKLVIKYGWPRI